MLGKEPQVGDRVLIIMEENSDRLHHSRQFIGHTGVVKFYSNLEKRYYFVEFDDSELKRIAFRPRISWSADELLILEDKSYVK